VENSYSHERLIPDRNRLPIVLIITLLYFVAELLGGYWANSLALMTDAVHLLTDIAALGLSLITLWIAARPATSGKTYGYLRAEILGALFNGLFLWLLVAFIWIEAVQRLHDPPSVNAVLMMLIAAGGVAVNAFSAWLTIGDQNHVGMAQRAVFLHVVSDLMGAGGVLIAGAIAYFTGWRRADPLVSFLIGGLIIYGSWDLVREGVDILMESVPAHLSLAELHSDLLAVKGAREIHDLHVWSLATHEFALSAHAVVAPEADHDRVLDEMSQMLDRKFNIRHVTLQLERVSRRDIEPNHSKPEV